MEEGQEDQSSENEEIFLEEGGEILDITPEEMEEVLSDMEDLDIDSDGEDVSDDNSPYPPPPPPPRDDASLCFSEHKGSVFSVDMDKTGAFACSGGEDDVAMVWTIKDGTVLFQCKGHKDSVICTVFSADGKYLATADMGGLIQVWLTSTGKQVWSYETADIEWMKWHSQAHILLAGCSDGCGWMWKMPSGECKAFLGETSRNICGSVTNDGKRLCCGYGNGSVKVLNLKDGVPIVSVTEKNGHSKPVTCVDTYHDNVLLLSGSEDETAKLINSNNGKVLSEYPAGFPPKERRGDIDYSVEAVCFSAVTPVALTGSISGVLGVWDLPTQKLRHQCVHKSYDEQYKPGVVHMTCSKVSPVVYTGALDGTVRAWDLRNGKMTREWHGHSSHILDMALLSNETLIASASDDNTVRLYPI